MSKRLRLILLMSLGISLAACSAFDATPTGLPGAAPDIRSARDVKRITPADARALLDNGTAVLFDTRTLNGYRNQHAAGAVSFPRGEETARFGELPTDKTLIFYCT
jgi:hypothetical protein